MRISETHLRKIIRNLLSEKPLSEITRYEREVGKKYNDAEEIEQYVSDEEFPSYGFTMTSIPKVGINPGTKFRTPAGIYFYPLNSEYFKKLITDSLPYVSDAPYVSVLKLNKGAKWLKFLSAGSDFASNEDVNAARKETYDYLTRQGTIIPPGINRPITTAAVHGASSTDSKFIEYLVEQGEHYKKHQSNDAAIYDATFLATRFYSKSTAKWTGLLRKLGWQGIYDNGNKIIHESEPFQGVCLEPTAYSVVATYETKSVRKSARTQSSTPRKLAAAATSPKFLDKLLDQHSALFDVEDLKIVINIVGNTNCSLETLMKAYEIHKQGLTGSSQFIVRTVFGSQKVGLDLRLEMLSDPNSSVETKMELIRATCEMSSQSADGKIIARKVAEKALKLFGDEPQLIRTIVNSNLDERISIMAFDAAADHAERYSASFFSSLLLACTVAGEPIETFSSIYSRMTSEQRAFVMKMIMRQLMSGSAIEEDVRNWLPETLSLEESREVLTAAAVKLFSIVQGENSSDRSKMLASLQRWYNVTLLGDQYFYIDDIEKILKALKENPATQEGARNIASEMLLLFDDLAKSPD